MGSNRALGLGMIGLGAVLGGLVLLWLLVTLASGDLQSGGFVLGLLLAAVLGLPPIGLGYYLLQRGRQEAVEEQAFVGQRRVIEQDKLFRTRIAGEAAQQAERIEGVGGENPQLARAASRLRQVAAQLQGGGYDQASWYEAVKLTDADVEALRQYDNLVAGGLRRISDKIDRLELGTAAADMGLLEDVQAWERELDQRLELLRGERPPTVAPGALLAADEPLRSPEAIAKLQRGDAVTYEEDDYLVEVTVTYFSGGRTWHLHRLGAEENRRWLYVAPGALELAMMEVMTPMSGEQSAEVEIDGTSYRLADYGSASATVNTSASASERVTVDYRHYRASSGELYWHERWPDRARAYRGSIVPARSLEIWPAERATEPTSG
jgi:hypothetical protein